MTNKRSIPRYKHWYAQLLRLYPKPYHDRFGEGMEQTFTDLLRERAEEERGLFGCAVWMFIETSVGIMRENRKGIIIQNTRRFMVWAVVVALIVMIPIAMQFTNEVQWNEAVAYSVILLAVGGLYELVMALRTRNKVYRFAFGVGLAGAFLLGWVNGAVGIIASEDNPANLMYGAVFAVGLIGSLISRFKPRGMARTLFAATFVQLLVPVFALFVWPAQASWGEPVVIDVFVFNSIFAVLFVVSALLFRRAARVR
ncbi:MAG: hypothetical protein JXM79_00920 [Sedimentisphaerales bacterium]|nr:hypothetical protein [Sedimentisphaerales bacterium]